MTDFITDKLSDALDELESYHTFDGKFWKYSQLKAEELLPADDCLQRTFKIGYNRANRLLAQCEQVISEVGD